MNIIRLITEILIVFSFVTMVYVEIQILIFAIFMIFSK